MKKKFQCAVTFLAITGSLSALASPPPFQNPPDSIQPIRKAKLSFRVTKIKTVLTPQGPRHDLTQVCARTSEINVYDFRDTSPGFILSGGEDCDAETAQGPVTVGVGGMIVLSNRDPMGTGATRALKSFTAFSSIREPFGSSPLPGGFLHDDAKAFTENLSEKRLILEAGNHTIRSVSGEGYETYEQFNVTTEFDDAGSR